MGTTAVPFRIKGGMQLSSKVEFQVFASTPSGAKADAMGVGSLVVASDTGVWYRKTTIGAGSDKWASLTTEKELIGLAPTWRPTVDAVETRSLTFAEAKALINGRAWLGGKEYATSGLERVLFAGLTDADPGVIDVAFYSQAAAPLTTSPAALYEIRATTDKNSDSLSGNALTYEATIDNPASATETTAVIVGDALTVNLKNDGAASTATVAEVRAAIEAVDTDNKFHVYHEWFNEATVADVDAREAYIVQPQTLVNFAGGTYGREPAAAPTQWDVGVPGADGMRWTMTSDGNWSTLTIILTHNTLDGDPATTAVLDEAADTLTVHLGNDGAAITATVGDVRAALDANTVSSHYGETYSTNLFELGPAGNMPDPTVIQAEYTVTTPVITGLNAVWGFSMEQHRDSKDSAGNSSKAIAVPGDTVYCEEGFSRGSVWVFSDGTWVKQGASNVTELGHIQNYIGKSGNGAESPTFNSTNIVTQGANLEVATGELDAEAGSNLTYTGKTEGEATPTYSSTNAVTQNANLKDGVSQLDVEVGFLLSFLGKAAGNEAPAYTTTKVVGQGTDLETAVSALDDLLGAAKQENKSTNVTTQVVADSIIMEQDLAAEWTLHVREVGNPGNVYISKILASHNADVGVSATQADFAETMILEMETPIDGLTISTDVETSGPLNARTMRLLIASTDAVDVTMTREVLRRQP